MYSLREKRKRNEELLKYYHDHPEANYADHPEANYAEIGEKFGVSNLGGKAGKWFLKV